MHTWVRRCAGAAMCVSAGSKACHVAATDRKAWQRAPERVTFFVCADAATVCMVLCSFCFQARDLADFLLPMLAFDPSERATAAQALKHPWLNGPSQRRSSRDERSAAAEERRSSRHSSRHGSDHGSRHRSQQGSRRSSRVDPDEGRKPSGSKRSSRPSAYTRSRSRPRSNSRGYEKRAR